MRIGRRILIAVAVLVIALIGTIAWFVWPRGTTPLTEDDALDDFRRRSTGTLTDSGPRGARPAVGVYRYSAEGNERVKFGPLPTETRTIPATITASVVHPDDRCFTFGVNFFAEHTEETRYCAAGDGSLTLDEHLKHQTIGAISHTATMRCDPAVVLPASTPSVPIRCELGLSGAPIGVDATLTGTATRRPDRMMRIGRSTVSVSPVTVSFTLGGDLTGTWTETTWFTEDRLPARIDRRLSLRGPATFTESSRLTLLDLTPTT